MKTFLLLLMALVSGVSLQAQTISNFVSIPLPDDMEVDRFGNVWVNYRDGTTPDVWHLAKITPDGVITNILSKDHELGMFGVNDSTIWIASSWAQGIVSRYDYAGNELDTIRLTAPTAIILDPDGTWYIAQNAIGRLTKVLPDKTRQVLASGSPLSFSLALARDENGMFYTCNLKDARVIKINPATGEKTVLATLPVASPYSLGFLAYNKGYLYVPSGRHCLYRVDTAGTGYTVFAGQEQAAGNENGSVGTALLNTPISAAFSVTGDTLYFTEEGNNQIRMITGMNATVGVAVSPTPGAALRVFPNPVQETLTIETGDPAHSIVSVSIISPEGRTVESVGLPGRQLSCTCPVSSLADGIYTVKIVTSGGACIVRQIVKLR